MSKLITISDEIAEYITTKGFKPVLSESFSINARLNCETIAFLNAYEKLEVDTYVLEAEGIPYRKRRYGSFIFNSKNNKLNINKHRTFLQSENVNSLFGGIERKFAPIDNSILENQFLQELIKADFSKFPEEDKQLSKNWFVGVQMFRVEAKEGYLGQPTPEGIHQDEHHLVVQHMMKKENVMHSVTGIECIDEKQSAIRDMLILDFELLD